MRRLRVPLIPNVIRWAAVLCVAGVILYYSIRPAPGAGQVEFGPFGIVSYSNWLHFLAYGGLAMTLAYALHDSAWSDWVIVGVVFALACGYGISIELIQATLAYRTFAVGDIGVNAVGVGVAVAGWRLLLRRLRFYQAAHVKDLKHPVE